MINLTVGLSAHDASTASSPLNNQILSLRGRDVSAARELVRQWGFIESGFAAIAVVAVAMFVWPL